ncbi:RNA ligase [Streptomyces sp. Edi2]|uniref:RNA ligase n=1 Tax=Streptomyces sp. Edi2 TaxID=3162528 RepID=UPI0033062740
MIPLATLFSPDDLAKAITDGHVVRKQHRHLPLSIFNYTQSCQYAGAWNAVTTRCRGLVVDERTSTVVAMPFEKFFNVAEHENGRAYAQPLPKEPFRIYDKVDGSLCIIFHFNGRWHAATKGSFHSTQANRARGWLDASDTSRLQPGTTYLAEIIYSGNRIVVDYGDREDLVLLGAYGADGVELDLEEAAAHWDGIGSVVRTWPSMDLSELMARAEANVHPDGSSGLTAEGYVLRFDSGVRAKAKLADYVHLHKIATDANEVDIWRYCGLKRLNTHPAKDVAKVLGCPVSEVTRLASGDIEPLEVLLSTLPDESYAWVRKVVDTLERRYSLLSQAINTAFDEHAHLAGDRRAFAHAVAGCDTAVRSGLFLRLDNRDPSLHIWRAIRPSQAPGPVAQSGN